MAIRAREIFPKGVFWKKRGSEKKKYEVVKNTITLKIILGNYLGTQK